MAGRAFKQEQATRKRSVISFRICPQFEFTSKLKHIEKKDVFALEPVFKG